MLCQTLAHLAGINSLNSHSKPVCYPYFSAQETEAQKC